ncbi:MAG TPA: DUF2975 domain-containing protein [Rhabdaerophilum sp.]|nr:DUF2975 domain-containing protein [Rhabdaerophilum sp.]
MTHSSFIPEMERPLPEALRRLSCHVEIVVWLSVTAAIAGTAFFLAHPLESGSAFGLPSSVKAFGGDERALRLRLLLALAPALTLFLLTAWQIRNLFRLWARGPVLDPGHSRRLVTIGWLLLAGTAVSIATRTFMALALTIDNPPGHRQLVIGFSLHEFVFVLFGLFVFAFARVMSEAARLADENRAFI